MMKLALRGVVLTLVLSAASLVSAEELVLSALILATIGLSTVALIIGLDET